VVLLLARSAGDASSAIVCTQAVAAPGEVDLDCTDCVIYQGCKILAKSFRLSGFFLKSLIGFRFALEIGNLVCACFSSLRDDRQEYWSSNAFVAHAGLSL
jgi:hypothetical protein